VVSATEPHGRILGFLDRHKLQQSHKISSQKHPSQLTLRTNLNFGILIATILSHSTDNCSHEVLNSHVQVFFNYEPSAAASGRELTLNELQSLLETLDRTRGRTQLPTVLQLLRDVTAGPRRSRDPSPLLRHLSVHTCRLVTGTCLPQRCVATFAARLGTIR
jgi:hypothetical protein